ncbi:MAG: hypothetical protein U0359_23190 [Byssovorax sp.]
MTRTLHTPTPPRDAPAHLTRISPSDAASTGACPALEIAGRVRACDARSAFIADAFGEIEAIFDAPLQLTPPASLAPGDLVVLSGALRGQTLVGANVVLRITPNHPPPPPAPSKDDNPHSETERLSLRGVGQGLSARARGLAVIRRFFEERRFLEVDTPALVPSPGLDLHLDALDERTPPATGNALGVDRLIAACLGTDVIGTVQSFPASWL